MNKKFLLLTAALIAIFSACSDNVVLQDPIPPNIAVEPKAKLSVLVIDAVTGTPLDAEVTLLSTGTTVTANAITGIAVFDSLYVGSYNLIIKKDDYASGVLYTSISLVNEATENILVASDKAEIHRLAPLGSGLSGYLFYEDATGKKLPATGARVRVQLSDDYLVKVYEHTILAEAEGKYVFDGLPTVGSKYELFALENTFGGVTYKTKPITPLPELLYDVTAYADKETTYLITDEVIYPFTLVGYTKAVNYTEPVIFEFSDAIDTKLLAYDAVTLSNGQVANPVWSGNKLTITPPANSRWTDNFYVQFNNFLTSVRGKPLELDKEYYISLNAPDLSATRIAGLINLDSSTIDYNTPGVSLRWNAVPNATGYKIYAKANRGSNDWYLAKTIISSNGKDTTAYVDVNSSYFANSGEVEFVVQAYNPSSQTSIDVTRAIKVFDRVKPSLDPYQYTAVTGVAVIEFGSSPDQFATNVLNARLLDQAGHPEIYTYRVHFSEPIDFATANGKWQNNLSGRLSVVIKPVSGNEYSLDLTLVTAGGAAITENISYVYELSVKDKRGNSFAQDYNWVNPAVKGKPTVDFMFKTNVPF